MLKSGNSWNLVPLPASNNKGGEKGMLKAPRLDQEEGQAIQLFDLASKNQPTSLLEFIMHTRGVGTSHE